jgi:hypothetical protein
LPVQHAQRPTACMLWLLATLHGMVAPIHQKAQMAQETFFV